MILSFQSIDKHSSVTMHATEQYFHWCDLFFNMMQNDIWYSFSCFYLGCFGISKVKNVLIPTALISSFKNFLSWHIPAPHHLSGASSALDSPGLTSLDDPQNVPKREAFYFWLCPDMGNVQVLAATNLGPYLGDNHASTSSKAENN